MPSKTSRRLGLDHDFKRRISAVTSDWLSAQKPDSAHRVVCLGSLDVAVLRGIAPFLLATCMFLSSICARAADITVIDFESIADCQTVDFQFSPQFGIIFDYSWVARANADGFAHSGRAYLRACSCGSEFCGLPIT